MTDALIADLAQIGGLRVISRTSAMRYKGAGKPLPEIARELNVDAGGRRHGVARRRPRAHHRAAHRRGDRPPSLGAELPARPERRAGAPGRGGARDRAGDPARAHAAPARSAGRRARHSARRLRDLSPAAATSGTSVPRSTCARESRYSSARSRSTPTTRSPTRDRRLLQHPRRHRGDALGRGLRARQGGGRLARSRSIPIWPRPTPRWPSRGSSGCGLNRAEETFRHALRLNPGYATGHQWFAEFLASQGRFDEATREAQHAADLIRSRS